MKNILITGCAGFIGYHLTQELLKCGYVIYGVDSVNDYYDVALKEDRLNQIKKLDIKGHFHFKKLNLAYENELNNFIGLSEIDCVINLAAQAGVRYSLDNPAAYVESNITAFTSVLEFCRYRQVKHLIYASTSSVYGADTSLPFSESKGSNHPLQFYAATKKANELMAHSYSNLFQIPTTGLRFFTVYGPWGRPDMALFLFTKNILANKPIEVFNNGDHLRDFTYVDDIVRSIELLIGKPPEPNDAWDHSVDDPSGSSSPYRILNIGNSQPERLIDYISLIEKYLNKKAQKIYLPIQPGDVANTCSNSSKLQELIGYKPSTSIDTGIKEFIDWYVDYYKV